MALLRGFQLVAISAAMMSLLVACSGDREPAEPQPKEDRETIWDLFEDRDDPVTTVRINRYIWNASLEVLGFLPLESVDPFSGVIITGWGRAPGSDKEYKATILVGDPALATRSLRVALLTRSGPADAATVKAIEDAIFTRARQLRQVDEDL
ncbi:MAG: DUF3576 domain-containing protein [Rhodobacteraceae bacterium]|nr:DUF3576 domain-containing protein [Paracoccaceae bacterium]